MTIETVSSTPASQLNIKLESEIFIPSQSSNPFAEAIDGNVEGLITGLSTTDNSLTGVSTLQDGSSINYPSHQPVAEIAQMFVPEGIAQTAIASKGTVGEAAIKPLTDELKSLQNISQTPEKISSDQFKTDHTAAMKAYGTAVGLDAEGSDPANGKVYIIGTTEAAIVAKNVNTSADGSITHTSPLVSTVTQNSSLQANVSHTVVTNLNYLRTLNSIQIASGASVIKNDTSLQVTTGAYDALSKDSQRISTGKGVNLANELEIFGDTHVKTYSPNLVQTTANKAIVTQSLGTINIVAINMQTTEMEPVINDSTGSLASIAATPEKPKPKPKPKKNVTKNPNSSSNTTSPSEEQSSSAGEITICSVPEGMINLHTFNKKGIASTTSGQRVLDSLLGTIVTGRKSCTVVTEGIYKAGTTGGGIKIIGGRTFIGKVPITQEQLIKPTITQPPIMPEMPNISSAFEACIPSKYKEKEEGLTFDLGSSILTTPPINGSENSAANPVTNNESDSDASSFSLTNPIKQAQQNGDENNTGKNSIPPVLNSGSSSNKAESSSTGVLGDIAIGMSNIGGACDIFINPPGQQNNNNNNNSGDTTLNSLIEGQITTDRAHPSSFEDGGIIDVEAFDNNNIFTDIGGVPTSVEQYLDLVQASAKVVTSSNQAQDAYTLSRQVLTSSVNNSHLTRVLNNSSGLVNTLLDDSSTSEDIRAEAERFVLSEVTRYLPANLVNAGYQIKDLIFNINSGNITPDQLVNSIASILGGITGRNEFALAASVYNNVRGIVSSVQRGDYQSLLSGQISGALAPFIGGENAAKVQAVMSTVLAGINTGKALSKLPEMLSIMKGYQIPALEQAALILQCTDLFSQIMALLGSIQGLINAFKSNENKNNPNRSNYNPYNSRTFTDGGRGLGTYITESLPRIIQIFNTVDVIRTQERQEFIEDPYITDILAEITGINLDIGLNECFKLPTLTLSQSEINIIRVEQNRIFFSTVGLTYIPATGDIIQYRVAYFDDVNTSNKLFPYQNDVQYTPSIYNYRVTNYNPTDNIGVAIFTPNSSSLILQRGDGVLIEFITQAIGLRLKPFIIDSYVVA